MERRNHHRTPVRVDAAVYNKDGHSWPFIIENVGFDGLLLKWPEQAPLPDKLRIGERLNLTFTIAHEKTPEHYQLEVKINRIHDDSIAVEIFNPAINALINLSREQLKQGLDTQNTSLDKNSRQIVEHIQQIFLNQLCKNTDIFFPVARDSLFEQAETSRTNSTQLLFFDAISIMDKIKSTLKIDFINAMEEQFKLCCSEEQSTSEKSYGELDLIAQDDFENWLAVNEIIVNTQPHFEEPLSHIKKRLAFLYGIEEEKIITNPFSPEIIFKKFAEVVHKYFENNKVAMELYKQFEKVLNHHLFNIYKEINDILIDNNILPVIEKQKLNIVKMPSESMEAIKQSAYPSTGAYSSPPSSAQPQGIPTAYYQATRPVELLSPELAEHKTEITTLNNSLNLVPTYHTLKELLSFKSDNEALDGSSEFFASEEYQQQLLQLVDDLTEVQKMHELKALNNEDNQFAVDSELDKHINKEKYAQEMINEYLYTRDIITRLFNYIASDDLLTKPVKKLLLLMQIPLLKVALLHKDVFESWSNPARIVINRLAMTDFDDEKNKFYIKARGFVLYILKNYQRELQVFEKVHEVLNQLLKIQAEYYNKNINKLIDKWNAQQIVTNELAIRLADKPVPKLIADLISYQWIPVLVTTYLKKGRDSIQWTQYLQVVDMLLLSIDENVHEEFIDKETILYILKQGLEETQQYDKKLLKEIENYLTGRKSSSSITLNQDFITRLLINGYALSDRTAILKLSKPVSDALTQHNKHIAKRLKVNDYVIFNKKNNREKLQFIWGSDNQNVFVFAGKSGAQQGVFTLFEVVSMLNDGRMSPTKEFDMPLMERSLYAVLGDVHDDMAKDLSRDKLTGLIKRTEFIRIFDEALETIKATGQGRSLCFVNIDKFNLINDTFGFEAGDQYLAQIAGLIRQSIDDEIFFARYGIDEFIFLLPDDNEQNTHGFAESLRKIIHNFTFNWEQDELSLAASIGVVMVSEYNDAKLFLHAVLMASKIAKETGGNRIHILEYDAIELNHRQELQLWATRIDQMVKHNQLDIRCHRLHPIADQTLSPHYEMLLLVKDKDGKHSPPAEFIEAAELYNKMVDVDRWVINYVLNWYSEHPEQLEQMGGVAINLSGHSLNDMDFLGFITEVFEQYTVAPERICFEITETVAIKNMNHAINIIHAIKDIGCEFSLDDFGTGLSSYAYLKNLPVDYLKIDGVFIKDIANNPEDRAMVKSINEIGHFLGMKTVAEYVENDEILQVLKNLGVDYAQGFGVEKPILIHDMFKQDISQLSTVH